MIPFAIKIVFFVLSITGWAACTVVLYAFGRSVNAMWAATSYIVGCALLQGIFCLGLIYRMDPLQMPRSFCLAQTILVSFGGFVLTGIALAFSLATSMTVLKPKSWGDGHGSLGWRNIYGLPVILFPLVASSIHIAFIMKFDSVRPSDDLHCDSSNPEWVRFLGYAGVPLTLSLPSLYLSIKSIIRVYKTNQHLQRSRPEDFDGLASFPRSPRRNEFSVGKAVIPSPHLSTFSERRAPISPALTGSLRGFHLPLRNPLCGKESSLHPPSTASVRGDQESDGASPRVSISFPTFAKPVSPGTIVEETRPQNDDGNESDPTTDVESKKDWQEIVVVPSLNESVLRVDKRWTKEKGDLALEYKVSRDEFVVPSTPNRISLSIVGVPSRKTRRPPPNLSPAVWRIILFQVLFVVVQCLACISTLVDVATSRPTPTPLGTQHVALLLAAWGPVIIFAHLPIVRRNLIPWRPVS